MADKLKKGATPAPSTEVIAAAKAIDSIEQKLQKLRGDASARYTQFEERGGNKAAFRVARKVKNMDATTQRKFIEDLSQYLVDFEVFAPATQIVFAQSDIFDEEEGDGTTTDSEDAASAAEETAAAGEQAQDAQASGEATGAEGVEAEIDLVAIEDAGKQACRDGTMQDGNPYDEDEESEQFNAWADGWAFAFNKGEAPAPEPEEDAEAAPAAA